MAAARKAPPKKKASAKGAEVKKPKRAVERPDAAAPASFRPFEVLKKRAASAKKTPTAGAKAAPPASPSRAPEPSFAQVMRGVKPLDPAQIRVAPPSEDDEAVAATLRSLVLEGISFEVIDDGATLQGRRVDVDPRELRRLRQEHYAIDGTLDLHKHSVAEARVAVVAFVARRAREGDKVLAIVHGKGHHSHGGEGVLRGEIGAWLSQGDAARHVLAFASVVDRLGESGRLLVMIR